MPKMAAARVTTSKPSMNQSGVPASKEAPMPAMALTAMAAQVRPTAARRVDLRMSSLTIGNPLALKHGEGGGQYRRRGSAIATRRPSSDCTNPLLRVFVRLWRS